MSLLPGVVVLGGLIWSYCSVKCQERVIVETFEEIEKKIKECKECEDAPGPEAAACACEPQPSTSAQSSQPSTSAQCQSTISARSQKAHRCKPGRVTNSTFFNFMRHNRINNRCLTPREAAALWIRMSDAEKHQFRKNEILRNKNPNLTC